MRQLLSLASLVTVLGLSAPAAQALTISYTGTGGAAATAEFTYVNSTTLTVLLTNTSVWPVGTAGGANLVLSSLNFDLPDGVAIIGGSVALGPGSSIVTKSQGAWATVNPSPVNLNSEYAYSNNGIGNSGTGTIATATNSLTSHTNGGNGAGLVRFDGAAGPGATNGLQPGILATGTPTFGNNAYWVMNSLLFTLNLSGSLGNLNFLANGSYVEFGSDAQFITGVCGPTDCPPPCTAPGGCQVRDVPVPEPTSLALLGMALLGAGVMTRRRIQA